MKSSHSVTTAKSSTRATYQDVLDAPPNVTAQIIDGTLYTNPRPAYSHAKAQTVLARVIDPDFLRGGGDSGSWLILIEPELHLDENIVVPDLAGWRSERISEHQDVAYFTVVPDWVCEVLSPSTREIDLSEKKEIYAREGVGYLWFVDPKARSLQVLVSQNKEWALIDTRIDDASVSLPPFEEIIFDLGRLWLPNVLHRAVPESESAYSPATESGAELSQVAK